MSLRWLFALLHLLALGIGLGAVWTRARLLARLDRGDGAAPGEGGGRPDSGDRLDPVFTADAWWLLALTVWLATGLVRAIAGLEKPGAFYVHSPVFWTKMAVFTVIFVLELWPMTAILQWGLWRRRGRPFEAAGAQRLAAISYAQAALVVVAAGLAVGLARGMG